MTDIREDTTTPEGPQEAAAALKDCSPRGIAANGGSKPVSVSIAGDGAIKKSSESGSSIEGTYAADEMDRLITKQDKSTLRLSGSRKETKKLLPPPPPPPPTPFKQYPDSTEEATSTFSVIKYCIYSNKAIGRSGQDGQAMACECRIEWDGERKVNLACGEDSDCMNRHTSMECVQKDSSCGEDCQNKRFQRCQYADVSVIKTDKKGYGLRANTALHEKTFIYEYVGEVIDENKFRRRAEKYGAKGIKHFYFMSLGKNEFIDATEKGGLARFCNHSCNPNCYVDKWVVGEKLRMGIFAKRDIIAGEELVFDYNVDRYGADPQTCYCGEPNCIGFIGGKTQTDGVSTPKLSHHIVEALALEDSDGSQPTRKVKKTKNPVENIDSRPLDESGVNKVMSALLRCSNLTEQWIVVKLLRRIQSSDDEAVPARVVHMHGYKILGNVLNDFKSDADIVLMVFEILNQLPRLTKNKITASKIEPIVIDIKENSEDERVRAEAKALLDVWEKLKTAFRIPRWAPNQERSEPEATPNPPTDQDDTIKGSTPEESRKSRSGTRSEAGSPAPPSRPPSRTPSPPCPPSRPQSRNSNSNKDRAPRYQRDIPWGWHKAWTENQERYYYSNEGVSTWEIPTQICASKARVAKIPPPPVRPGEPGFDRNVALLAEVSRMARVRAVVKAEEALAKKEALAAAKAAKNSSEKEEEEDYDEWLNGMWRRETEEDSHGLRKTKAILSHAFATPVANLVNKYHPKIGGKKGVKKYAKEITTILVAKEVKNHGEARNPGKVMDDEEKKKKVAEFIDGFMAKVIKHLERKTRHKNEKKRRQAKEDSRKESRGTSSEVPSASPSTQAGKRRRDEHGGSGTGESPKARSNDPSVSPSASMTPPRPISPGKRRRADDDDVEAGVANRGDSPKRLKAMVAGVGGLFVC